MEARHHACVACAVAEGGGVLRHYRGQSQIAQFASPTQEECVNASKVNGAVQVVAEAKGSTEL